MTKTTNYQLPKWEKTDRIQMKDFNDMTATLDAALKAVLGDHVHQAGSLVEPDRLRFDFTHFESITPEQLLAVDTFVNDAILRGIPVVTEVLPIEEAKKKGAVAMFGEKYGDVVRVVEMGNVSMEFCGGTHLDNTAKVGLFRIKSEGSVASGVRRIEAITGKQTLAEIRRNQERAMYMDLPYVIMLTIASVFTLYLCINYLHVQSSITARMHHIEQMEAELEQLRAENDALETSINTSIDLNKIYEIATKELGMVYAKKDQVLLYDKTESEYVRQYEDIPEH